jgi:hypothetical protein
MGCKSCFGSRRSSRFGLNPGQGWTQDARWKAMFLLNRDKHALYNFYKNIYVNKTIHIKGTPTDKRYHVVGINLIDADLANPVFF